MALTELYIAVSVIALLVIAALIFFVARKKKKKPFSPLAGLAFVFVIAGIISGDDRLIGYSLMSIGIILAVIDIIKSRSPKN